MVTIQAFKGWRYDPGKVDYADVVTPPYDVITPEMQEALYAKSEYNAVRLIFGRKDESDTDQDNRYTRAAAHLDAWRESGMFLQDRPSIYYYEQEFDAGKGETVTRRGFFCRVLLSEWGKGGIFPHEKTLAGPKVDRLNLMRALRGQSGPVFGLLSDDDNTVSEILGRIVNYDPVATITDDKDVINRLWVVDHEERVAELVKAAAAGQIFIADGHHRYETALAYRNEVREQMKAAGKTPPELGELDSDYIYMFVVPDSDPGLVIWPTHRLVYGIENFDASTLLEACRKNFAVEKLGDDEAALQSYLDGADAAAFVLVLPDGNWGLTLAADKAMDERASDAPEPWRRLDVSTLHLLILEDLLGIDEGKLLRKENIVYSKDLGEAVRMSKNAEQGVQAGFLMRPTPMSQVRDVARAGSVMPQKSTYFYPKVLTGLMLHLFW